MTGSAAKGAESAGMHVVPDLDQRLAKFRQVEMPFHSAGLTAREVKMVNNWLTRRVISKKSTGGRWIPTALTLYESLAGAESTRTKCCGDTCGSMLHDLIFLMITNPSLARLRCLQDEVSIRRI